MYRNEATEYVRRIRNKAKREYAISFHAYLIAGKVGPEPPRPPELSGMAAQAVKLNLYALCKG